MKRAYYNEYDPKAAEWIRQLIKARVVADGDVDERSITEVKATDLVGYGQVHLFAGIGGWSRAFRLAGIPDDSDHWSISCPCPPFSAAGKKKFCVKCGGRPFPCPWLTGYFTCSECDHSYFADERHLWPEAWRLVAERRPSRAFGEQVASDDGRVWLAGVRATLELVGFTVGASDTCAAGVGSPNIRQRIYWDALRVDLPESRGPQIGGGGASVSPRPQLLRGGPDGSGIACGLAHPNGRLAGDGELQRSGEHGQREKDDGVNRMANTHGRGCGEQREQKPAGIESASRDQPDGLGELGRLGDAEQSGLEGFGRNGDDRDQPGRIGTVATGSASQASPVGWMADASSRGRGAGSGEREGGFGRAGEIGFWDAFDLVHCTDGKARRIEPGTFPLAHGVPGRVGLLRGYGNAINPYQAAHFIRAALTA